MAPVRRDRGWHCRRGLNYLPSSQGATGDALACAPTVASARVAFFLLLLFIRLTPRSASSMYSHSHMHAHGHAHGHAHTTLPLAARSPGSADWAAQLAYGAGGTVVVCDPRADGTCPVSTLLVGHVGKVNCVRWFRSSSQDGGADGGAGAGAGAGDARTSPVVSRLASGGADASVIVWGPPPSDDDAATAPSSPSSSWKSWGVRAVLKGHTEPVTCVDALSMGSDGHSLVCSASADGEEPPLKRSCAVGVALVSHLG
jgi:WD40 repeat protein